MANRRVRMRRGTLLVLAGLTLWTLVDLYGPRRADIRRFDAHEVAHLDTEMWRSYYDRKPVALFFQLAELMRRQFHFPLIRSYVVAGRAARAAFVFKDGHGRDDYRRALPDLVAYYGAIRKISTTSFDVERTAELELEWWIVHRERSRQAADALERALAEAAAELYRVPVANMSEYAHYRTLAMNIRDTRAAAHVLGEEDWGRIERRLIASWRALKRGAGPPDGDVTNPV